MVVLLVLVTVTGNVAYLGPRRGAATSQNTGVPTSTGEVMVSSSLPTPIRHVFVVVLENEEAKSVLSGGPFATSLAENYSYASNYYAACHPSTPNYLALTSGDSWQCGTNDFRDYATSNLGDLLDSAGRSWDAFMETMPKPCDVHGYASYSPDPNAFVHYDNIVNDSALCNAHDLPFTSWYSDVANGTIPNYALFVPNLTDVGHNSGLKYADHWLESWLTPYL